MQGYFTKASEFKYYCQEIFFNRTLAVLPGKESESRKNIRRICDTFASSGTAKDIDEKVQEEVKLVEPMNTSGSSNSLESVF